MVSVSTSRSRDGLETYQRLETVSRRIPTSGDRLEKNCQRLGLGRQTSRSRLGPVSTIYVSCPRPIIGQMVHSTLTRCSAIAERPHCRVHHSFGQKWKTGTGRQYFTDIIHCMSKFHHGDIIGLKIYRFRRKKRTIKAITAFKVIQGHRGRYQSNARMRLPISD